MYLIWPHSTYQSYQSRYLSSNYIRLLHVDNLIYCVGYIIYFFPHKPSGSLAQLAKASVPQAVGTRIYPRPGQNPESTLRCSIIQNFTPDSTAQWLRRTLRVREAPGSIPAVGCQNKHCMTKQISHTGLDSIGSRLPIQCRCHGEGQDIQTSKSNN